jgi:signal transduction histidine kinase
MKTRATTAIQLKKRRMVFAYLEQERERIAKVLHEDIAQLIAADALSSTKTVASRPHLRDAIVQLRRLAYTVGAPLLPRFGLSATLEELAVRVVSRENLKLSVPLTIDEEDILLRTAIFRIAQEIMGLQVVQEHQRIEIKIERKKSLLKLKICVCFADLKKEDLASVDSQINLKLEPLLYLLDGSLLLYEEPTCFSFIASLPVRKEVGI